MNLPFFRTFRAHELACLECEREIDSHQKHFFMEMVSDCWLFVRLQMVTGVFLASLGAVIVLWRSVIHWYTIKKKTFDKGLSRLAF